MNKKLKLAIPCAVLAVSCGLAVAFTGCTVENDSQTHTHTYSQWAHDDTYHWKVCPADGEIDESSKEEHVFIAGECDCGATKQIGPVADAKYGKVTGSVKLYKQGAYITDALSGVRVDMGNDDVEISGSVAEGKYSFTIENVQVDKLYTLTISCTGYSNYSTEIMLEEEGEEAKIGGTNGVTLDYEVFTFFWGFDSNLHDLSRVNDADPTIGVNGDGGKTLNVISTDKYGDVSATIHAKSSNAGVIQGLLMKFEDGKAAIFNLKTDQSLVQFRPKTHGILSIFDPNDTDKWMESPSGSVTDEEKAKFNGEGIDVTLTRKGGKLYAFLDGRYVYSVDLPAGYEDDKIQVGLFAFDVKANAVFSYNITDEVPEMQSTLNIDVTNPSDGTACSVTASPQKDAYDLNEEVELTFTAPVGYKLDSLTVGGDDMLNEVSNGKLTIKANKISLDVSATFVKEQPIALNLSVKGKKLGTTAALADNTTVTFKNTDYSFTVNNGQISAESVTKGRYTVVVDGYFEKQIDFDENLTEVTLEYDLMENLTVAWGWSDYANLDEQNDGKLTQVSGGTQWVSSKDGYGSVAITATVVSGGLRQGVFIRFKGDGYSNDKYVMIQKENNDKVSWNGESNIWGNGSNLCGDWTSYVEPLTDADLEKINAGEYELTLVRDKNKIYVFVNGKYYDTKVLDASYADMQCYVGVYCINTPSGAQRSFRIEDASEYLVDVVITDGTAANANGSIEISKGVGLGETVTITVKPDKGYMIDTITVSGGVTPTAGSDNTYTFVAMEKSYTITATFKEAPANEAETSVTGIGLGATSVDMSGKEITFTAAGGTEIKLTVSEGKVKGVLAAGEYTVSCDGFYDLTATVTEGGSFAEGTSLAFEKIIFEHNGIGEPQNNLNESGFIGIVADSTSAASEGKITVSEKGSVYEWTVDEYDDVAISFTFKKKTEEQGIMMLVANQKVISVRFQDNNGSPKMQWLGDWYGSWFWGTQSAISTFDFGEDYLNPLSSDLLAKYNGEGLKVTLLRKDSMLYVLVDGKLCTAHILGQYADSNVKFGLFVKDTEGSYDIPFEIDTDVDAILQSFTSNGVMGVSNVSNLTATDSTLSVNGRGYVEFAPTEVQTKESLTITISDSKATKQGLTYRFADGKWLGFRYEPSYIQYTEDIMISGAADGRLKGWTTIYNLTDGEKTAFAGEGISLSLVRDGKYIYVMLGGNVIDKVIMGDEYATMDGVIAATVEGGTGTAYAYEYKTGENVVVPQVYAVTASVDGAAHGYNVSVDKSLANNGDSVTVTITASQNWYSAGVWSYFPTAIVVDGQETALTTDDLTSIEANRCSYTYTIANVIADTTIQFKVTQLDCIQGLVKVSVDGEGGTASSDSGENGYHWNDGCDVEITPDENYEIESITITRGENGASEVITEGWGTPDENGKYTYTVSGGITEQTTIVVKFRAKITEPTTGGEEGGSATDTPAE